MLQQFICVFGCLWIRFFFLHIVCQCLPVRHGCLCMLCIVFYEVVETACQFRQFIYSICGDTVTVMWNFSNRSLTQTYIHTHGKHFDQGNQSFATIVSQLIVLITKVLLKTCPFITGVLFTFMTKVWLCNRLHLFILCLVCFKMCWE